MDCGLAADEYLRGKKYIKRNEGFGGEEVDLPSAASDRPL
jgi:hypothetical protein